MGRHSSLLSLEAAIACGRRCQPGPRGLGGHTEMSLYQYPQTHGAQRVLGARGTIARTMDVLLAIARPRLREMVFVGLLLLVLAAAVFGAHIRKGSFYYDDWANAAIAMYPPKHGFFGVFEAFWQTSGFRPLLVPYTAVRLTVLGLHEHAQIAWAVFLAVLMSLALYWALTALRFGRIHAGLIAGLVLVFPFSDSTRLWSMTATASLVVALYLVGVVLALRGLQEAERRPRMLYHAGAVACFVAAVSTYEAVATVALSSVALYLLWTTWRRALSWFVVDVVAIGAVLLWVLSNSRIDKANSANGGMVFHARMIFHQGLQMIAASSLPFGAPSEASVLSCLGVVLAVGGLLWWRLPQGDSARAELARWLLVVVGGIAFAGIAWAVYIPANPYYSPLTEGLGNRVNVVAAIGLVAAVYGAAMLVGTLVVHGLRAPPRWSVAFGLVAALVLGVGYVRHVRTDESTWDLAARDEGIVLRTLRQQLPHPVSGSTIFTFGHPNEVGPGIVVFASSWDLNGAAEILYHDPSLNAYPLLPGNGIVCGPESMFPVGGGYSSAFGKPYGLAYLVDIGGKRVAAPHNQAQCKAVVNTFVPGPSPEFPA
jgi:hypothetical protein